MENTKNLQKSLYVLVGAPACGKSSWASKQKDKIWISRDKVRFSLTPPDKEYFSNENKVFKTFVSKIQEALDNGNDVIADATHVDAISRGKLLRKLNLEDTKLIAIDFQTSIDTCIERNALRSGRACVPVGALRMMARKHTSPLTDTEFIFDEVIEIKEDNEVM